MQRSTLLRGDPWDRPVPVATRDRHDADQQVIPKCPLPILNQTRSSMREGDAMARERFSARTAGNVTPVQGKGMYETIDKNFRASTPSFNKSNARSASVSSSPRKLVQTTRASLPPTVPTLYPDLNITAQQLSNAKALADRHRSKRWQLSTPSTATTTCSTAKQSEASSKAQVTSPVNQRRLGSFCHLEEPQPRDLDVPQQVSVLPRRASSGSYVDDDDTLSESQYSAPPKQQQQVDGYWAPPTPLRQANNSEEPSSPDDNKSIVPSPFDKSSVKKMAVQHRRSFCVSNHRRSSDSQQRQQQQRSSATTREPLVTPPASPDVAGRRVRPAPAMVEICPGLSAPLRGSDETLKAVANRFYTTTVCFGCCLQIHCIADVQYTICPHCRVISPLDDDTFEGEVLTVRWGLGLGFTEESLWDMQAELAAKRFGYH